MSRRRIGLTAVAATAWILVAINQAFGQNDCMNCVSWLDTPGPVWENAPGHNLYWHDPYLGFSRDCQDYTPDIMGCPTTWFAEADALMLFRNPRDKFPFATVGPSGPVALSTSDFQTDFDAGIRAVVGRALGDWYRVEFGYFGSHSWSDTAAVRNLDANAGAGTGNLYSPFSNFGNPAAVVGQDFNNFASLSFSSRLNNAEVNLRRRLMMRPGCYEASFLIGARYTRIDDAFGYRTESTTPGPAVSSNDVTIGAENDMYGAQIGLTAQFLVQRRYWIDFDMKGAIMQNQASQSTVFTRVDNNGASTTFAGSDQRDRTSFIGELSLQLNYQFSPALTFYAGYNALWVTGLALGPNNFESDINILTLGPARLDHGGEAVYHGPNIGLVLAR